MRKKENNLQRASEMVQRNLTGGSYIYISEREQYGYIQKALI